MQRAIRWAMIAALGTTPACRACHSGPASTTKGEAGGRSGLVPSEVAGWTVEPRADGTALVRYNNTDIAGFKYQFFLAGWKWAGPRFTAGESSGDVSTFTIDVPALKLRIDGKVEPGDPGELVFTYDMHAEQDVDGLMGGGVEFRLANNPTLRKQGASKPELLDANGGFEWDVGGGDPLHVTFSGGLDRVFFERGRPQQIRAFFFGETLKQGRRTITMRLKLPAGGQVAPSLEQRYGEPDPNTWHANSLAYDRWPIDLSWLNAADRPAGKHGSLKAQADALVFADGTPARFWGANIAAKMLYTGSHEDVARQAKRLAAMGFNLVRLHHHDSRWFGLNVFDLDTGTTQKLRDQALEQLDWWVKCLQDEGIYVWLDLHTGRSFTAADGIEGYEELARRKGEGKSFNYVNPRIEALLQRFAEQYLFRKNRYTGRAYQQDPGLVAVLVTNENDITNHGGRLFVPKSGARQHIAMFRKQANAISDRLGLSTREALNLRNPGASKIMLNELEARFAQRAIKHLRQRGYRGPIATTNWWGKNPLYSLPALTVGDLIDAHAYGQEEFLGVNPLYEPNFISWLASGQVANMPYSISEWNIEYPGRDRFAAPLYMAAISALQGWDAPMLYVYSQHPLAAPRRPGKWSSWYDAATMAMMPAAALAYRQGHISPAREHYRLRLSKQTLYGDRTSAKRSAAIRTLAERSRIDVELPDLPELDWDRPMPPVGNAIIVDDLERSFLDTEATAVTSDTGELMRDWASGIQTIDSPKTQAVQGWIGGRSIALTDVEFTISTPKAAVSVTSLDGKPIATSSKLLITAIGQVAASPGNTLPLLAQPIEGRISVKGSRGTITPQMGGNPTAGSAKPISVTGDGDRIDFVLPATLATHWFVLER